MNPFDGIANFFLGLIHQGKMAKWYKLTASCLIGAFIGFWGTWGIVGLNLMAVGQPVAYALAVGFFSACSMMATVVLLTVRRSGVWKDLSLELPAELEKTLETQDVTQIKPPADPTVRKVLE